MKTVIIHVTSVIFGIILAISVSFVYSNKTFTKNATVKPHQIYHMYFDHIPGVDNPFVDEYYIKSEVIDVKDGYVLYIENDTDTLTSTVKTFLIGNELQSK